MDAEIAKKIVEQVFEIGESSEHYAAADFSTNKKTFAVRVFIHSKDKSGLSAGLADAPRYFYSDSSYSLHNDWLNEWKDQIRAERGGH